MMRKNTRAHAALTSSSTVPIVSIYEYHHRRRLSSVFISRILCAYLPYPLYPHTLLGRSGILCHQSNVMNAMNAINATYSVGNPPPGVWNETLVLGCPRRVLPPLNSDTRLPYIRWMKTPVASQGEYNSRQLLDYLSCLTCKQPARCFDSYSYSGLNLCPTGFFAYLFILYPSLCLYRT